MPKSNLIDFCVVIGSNKDTNLEKLSCEGSQGYGPYKQNVLAVLSENIAYFPESYHVIDGSPYYASNEVICPKAHHEETRSIYNRSVSCTTEVLPFSMEVVNNLTSFCFPSGGYAYTSPQSVQVSFLVLTNMEGSRTYAVYLTCTREYVATSDEQGVIKIANNNLTEEESFILHVPMCFCLVSSYPYFNTMKDCLSSLGPFLRNSEEDLWTPVMNLAFCLSTTPVPPPGPLSVQISLLGIEHVIHPADETNHRVIDIDLRLPLFILTPDDIVKVITCLLTQQRMIFMATEYSMLVMVIEAFLTYIDPFQWRLPYVPVLPDALADLIEATGPFIMGVHSSLRSQVKQVRKEPDSWIVLVDLDRGIVDINANTKVPPMPDIVSQSLNIKLKKCSPNFDLKLVSAPSVFSFEAIKQQQSELMEKFKCDIKDAFFDVLVSLFGDIYNYMTEQFFDKVAYLQSKHEDEKAFFEEVLSSDSFNTFIEDRIKHRDRRDSFLLLGERLSTQRISTSRSRSSSVKQPVRFNSVFEKKSIYKMPNKFRESLSTGRYYNSHYEQLTLVLQGAVNMPNSLKASYLYLRGFAQIISGDKIEGLRDLYSLYSLSPDLFPAEDISEVIDSLDAFQLKQIKKEPFYQETATLRTISSNCSNTKGRDVQKFNNSDIKLDREVFLKRMATLKITESEETALWLFQVLLNESSENADFIQPDQFTTFYKMYLYMLMENREVSGVKIDVADRIMKVSSEVSTGKGMGRIVLTTKHLLFVQQGAREYSIIAHLCDVKELVKYQQFSAFLTGIQALRIINSDRNVAPFYASLKEERNIWVLLLTEMIAGHKASIALSNPKMIEQAVSNVHIAQTLLAMGFPLPVVAGVCLISNRKVEEIGSLSEETRESLVMRLDPCAREGKRTTVMSIAYVPGNVQYSSTIWCGMGSGAIVVYETEKWQYISELRCAKSRISCLRYVDTNQVWAGSFDSVIYVISTVTTKSEQQLQNHWRSVSDIAIDDSPDSHALIWSSGFDGQVFCWHSETRECITSFTLNDVRTLRQIIPTNDKKLWCITLDNIIVVDVSSKECPILRHLVVPNKKEPVHFSYSMKLNDEEIWIGSKPEGRLIVWNTKTYKCEQIELEPRVQICSMIFAGESVWIGNKDGKVFVMCPITKVIDRELNAHTDHVISICETHKGNVITGSSSKDGQLCVWNSVMGFEVIDGKRRYRKNTCDDIRSTFEVVDDVSTTGV